jgi:hypothetical protein
MVLLLIYITGFVLLGLLENRPSNKQVFVCEIAESLVQNLIGQPYY